MNLVDIFESGETYYKHKVATCCICSIQHVVRGLHRHISWLPCSSHSNLACFHRVVFWKSIFYICTNAHLFYLIGSLYLVLRDGVVDKFGEIVVGVCICMCMNVWSIQYAWTEQRSWCLVHHIHSLYLSLQMNINALQFTLKQCLHLFLCSIAKCYSQRHFRMT